MEASEAEKLAWELLDKWECNGWVFQWFNRKRSFGMVNYRRRVLYLSRYLVALNDEDETRDTILHEIAHIKAGPRAGHGPKWKEWARRVGSRPKACYGQEVASPEYRYRLVCTACGAVLKKVHRKPANLAKRYHIRCGPSAVGKLEVRPIESKPEVPIVTGRKVKVTIKRKGKR